MPVKSQLDLFADSGFADPLSEHCPVEPAPPVQELDDAALIAAIPAASNHRARQLVQEAARRRGRAAGRMVDEGVIGAQGLPVAVSAARHLGVCLSAGVSATLLRHSDPAVRADAAYCCPTSSAVTAILTDLLNDLHPSVALAAACALGRMGRAEARPTLLRALGTKPTAEVIEAAVEVANETIVVMLGRIARSNTALRAAALAGLRDIGDDRAMALVATLGED